MTLTLESLTLFARMATVFAFKEDGLRCSCILTSASISDAFNLVGTAAECAVLSEQSGLRGCILQNESWAENGHRAAAEPGMWLGHRVPG